MAHVIVCRRRRHRIASAAALAAAAERVVRLTVIDRDRYDADQHASGKDRAPAWARRRPLVQARRCAHHPDLPIPGHSRAVEDLPLGSLRGDVILASLDSRRPAWSVNQAAWRLGVPGSTPASTPTACWRACGVRSRGPKRRAWSARGTSGTTSRGTELSMCARQRAVRPTHRAVGSRRARGVLAGNRVREAPGRRQQHLLAGRDVVLDARHQSPLRHRDSGAMLRAGCRTTLAGAIAPSTREPAATTLDDLLQRRRT